MLYFYLDTNRAPQGPFSQEELLRLLQEGELTPHTEVATKGEAAWRPLAEALHLQAEEQPLNQTSRGVSFTSRYFRTEGRLARAAFWCRVLSLGCTIGLLRFAADNLQGVLAYVTEWLYLILFAVSIPIFISMAIRRMHDIGSSGRAIGWLLLLPPGILLLGLILTSLSSALSAYLMLPLLILSWGVAIICTISLLTILILAMLPGTPGANTYGPQPTDTPHSTQP